MKFKHLFILLLFCLFIPLQMVPAYALEGYSQEEVLQQDLKSLMGDKSTKDFIVEQLKIVRDSFSNSVQETEGFTPVEDVDGSSQGLVASLMNLSKALVVFLDVIIGIFE